MKFSRYSLITLTSMPSHSFQQAAQIAPRTRSLTGLEGDPVGGRARPVWPQREQVIVVTLSINP